MEIKTESNQIYSPIRDKWLVLKPEEEVRQRYVCRLVDSYGYGIKQMGEEVKVTNSQRGQGAARADIVIWRNEEDKRKGKNALIVVECKAENVTIRQADYFQGYNYAAWAGAKFFVTTNLKETRIFKVVEDAMPKKLEEIADIPSADIVDDDKKIKAMLLQTKAFTRDEFSRLLFKCHNIIRNNDKLSPEAAFDEISKILFIKIRYERTNSGTQIFSKEEFLKQKKMYDAVKSKESPDYYQFLFNKTKEDFAKDHLFDENETIKIRENSFEQIVKELQVYNLSTTSDDVKGIAFEQFLGRTFRGELGQFFTPRTIVDFMVSVLDPQEGEYVCDPCCGSGGFLIRAFEYVREHIENEVEVRKEDVKKSLFTDDYSKLPKKEQEKNDQKVIDAFSKMNYELDINNPMGRLRSLSFDCIYGTDANPRMARTAKMNMIMHGDGHGGVHHHDGLLNVNGIWEGRFDVILTNPPFGARIDKELKITEADRFTDIEKIKAYEKRYGKENYDNALKQVNDHINQPILDLFQIGKFSGLTEVLFIERCLNLLKPGGRMGIVLPEGVLNNTNLQKVRDFVESKAKILLIVSIPQDVFMAAGATVKPSLLFFKKFTENEAEEYNRIYIQVSHEVEAKYDEEMTDIDVKLAKRGKEALTKDEKKSLRSRKKELTALIENEIKVLVKERFDYVIPIAEVQKAGISTTGAKIENELEPLEKEFTEYRKENKLWEKHVKATKYNVSDDGTMLRTRFIDGVACEPEPFYRY
ncbi:N-6 DNA methylase [Prevotella copri]|uniref:N-6 DNA methylase n=1 Tax=Segatella copri TaxID=165179 RepID=A0AAW5IG56_9BACT|nr:N-6 DNA methylase [Segatella copri]MCP9534556.1 N-6 DNA methylase [Segatella copri]MCP9537236.1 N-6 DNA methylase [Segatella copri]MCP9540243.1 N-6 DNA methylase [Segatella copri]MCP9558547.1 N-6 DNA methylase [Segatella copri]MCP9561352.1 N-6 DNA methylase [Segatella copri]